MLDPADLAALWIILNIVPATVEAVACHGTAQTTVRLQAAGIPFLSRITRKSATALGLEPGRRLYAQVKDQLSHAVFVNAGAKLTVEGSPVLKQIQHLEEVGVQVLLGGLEVIETARALLVGGHSVEDPEFKYGLSVTGTVHPDRVVTNSGARPGDRLILTKPLGTGVLATAIKGGLTTPEVEADGVRWMTTLNRDAAEAMQEIGVHACTDITGFGLLGHALEMARASRVTIEIRASLVPLIPGVRDLALMGMIPAGSFANRSFCEHAVTIGDGVDPLLVDLIADAQTSGGLLIAVATDRADELHTALDRRHVPHPEIGRVGPASTGIISLSP